MSTNFLSDVRSIIHVGANEGQERDLYAEHNLSVLWVEALPTVYAILDANLTTYPRQRAVQALVTDKAGQRHIFHVSSNIAASSSIYNFALHRDIWPDVVFTHDVELISDTLDAIIKRQEFRKSADALVMDVQGAELLVLLGAEKLVKQVRYIKTEAADFNSYEGGTNVNELIVHLTKCGFDLVEREAFAEHPAGGRYYELLFKRRPPSWLSRLWPQSPRELPSQ